MPEFVRHKRIPDLADPKERARLSSGGLKGFFKIASEWHLTSEQQRGLLALSEQEYEALRRPSPHRVLDQGTLTRISCLIGCYKALHEANGEKIANEWMQRPNIAVPFNNRSAVEYMIAEGLPAFDFVREHLTARAAGNSSALPHFVSSPPAGIIRGHDID